MHRTQGDGIIEPVSGKRLHVNRSSTEVGTTGDGNFFNALQEELVNVIEYAGITIKPDNSSDESEGYIQLKKAIFESSAIDTAALKDACVTNVKIDSLSLSKISIDGDLSVSRTVSGDVFKIEIDPESIQITETAATDIYEEATLTDELITFKKYEEHSGADKLTRYSELGQNRLYIRSYDTNEDMEYNMTIVYTGLTHTRYTSSGNIVSKVNEDGFNFSYTNSSGTRVSQLDENGLDYLYGSYHIEAKTSGITHYVGTKSGRISSIGTRFDNTGYYIKHRTFVMDDSWTEIDTGEWWQNYYVSDLKFDETNILDIAFSYDYLGGTGSKICPKYYSGSVSSRGKLAFIASESGGNWVFDIAVPANINSGTGVNNRIITVWYTEDIKM